MTKVYSWLLLFVFMTSLATAESVRMDREKFVHMSDADQKDYIVKTMELVVELESHYQYQVNKVGFNWERYKRYTRALEKLQNILISSAHAQSFRRDWATHAKEFQKLIAEGNTEKCLYAGWISRLGGEGNKYCVHPSTLPPGPEKSAYEAGNGCGTINQITCNPTIFGFKNESTRTLFCVPAGQIKNKDGEASAHNSSLACMTRALNPATGEDSKEKRIAFLQIQQSAESNKVATTEINNFVFKSCVCDTPPPALSSQYQKYIRPHRTCFGLMSMLGESNKCEKPVIDSELFKKLQTAIAKRNGEKSTDLDKFYDQVVTDIQKSSPADYNKFCGIIPVTPPPKVTTDEKKDGNVSCSSMCVPDKKKQGKISCALSFLTEDGTEIEKQDDYVPEKLPMKANITVKAIDKQVECDLTPGDIGFQCEGICTQEAGKPLVCEYTASRKVKDTADVVLKPTPVETPKAIGDIKVTVEGGKDQYNCKLRMKDEEKKDVEKNACTIAPPAVSDDKKTLTATVTPTPMEGSTPKSIAWSDAKTGADKPEATFDLTSPLKISASVVFVNKDKKEETVTCDTEYKTESDDKDSGDKKYDLKTKQVDSGTDKVNVSAEISGKTDLPLGHTVSWQIEAPKTKAPAKKDPVLAGAEEVAPPTDDKKEGLAITVDRRATAYKACATLNKGADKVSGPDCQTIAPKGTVAPIIPRAQTGNGFQTQQPIMPPPQSPGLTNGIR